MNIPSSRLAVLSAGVLVVGGVGAFGAARLFAASAPIEYRTAPVQRSNVTQSVAVSGAVNPASQVRLSFESGGRLAAILVSVGQNVAAGDVLAKLDDTDERVSLQQAAANLNAAQAKYNATLSGTDVATLQLSVDQAQRTLDRLLANFGAAKANLEAIFQGARADRTAAQASFLSAQATLATLQSHLANVIQQVSDVRTATTAANAVQANFQSAQTHSALLDAALLELNAAAAALKDQIARADAGAPDVQAYGLAHATYSAALARAQSGVDALGAPLASASTSVNSIIASLIMTQNNGDQSVDPARADAALLLVQLTTAQQQLTLTKARLGSLTGTLSTITDAITGASIVNAQNAVANARQSLQTKLDNRNSDVQSAVAALQSAQASYANAQNALTKLTLTASASGVVASIGGQVGEFVGGGGAAANAFIVLTGASGLALHGTVGEADIARLALGQVATLTVDAVGTEKRFTGKVTNLDPVATLQQGVPVYGIDITLDVVDPGIRAGMSGSANVIIANKRDVLVVPNLAIRSLGGQRGVQVLRDGEPVAVTDVRFGIASDQVTEVTSGLAEGDLVVLPTARSSSSQLPAGGGQFRVAPGGGPVR